MTQHRSIGFTLLQTFYISSNTFKWEEKSNDILYPNRLTLEIM